MMRLLKVLFKQITRERALETCKERKFTKGKPGVSSKKKNFSPCSHCRRTNHAKKDCWYKDKPSFHCTFCNNLDHNEKYCKAKKKKNSTTNITTSKCV